MRTTTIAVVVIVAVVLALTAAARAVPAQQAKLTADDGAANDYFGISVAISGSYAVAGAQYDDDNGNQSGSAYVFYKDQGGANNWGQVAKLTADDGTAYDYLGRPVGISGSYVIAGAHRDNENGDWSGSAYVFYRDQGGSNNWGQQAKLTATDGAAYDYFGYSAAISGSYAVAGARNGDGNVDESGSAYVFYRDQGGSNNWGQQAKLTANDGAADDDFGYSVAISGSYAVVGAPGDGGPFNIGSAHVFCKDQGGSNLWGQVTKLTASDGSAFDNLGLSTAISGSYAVVGASGKAYVFYKDEGGSDNWGQVAKLTAFDGDENGFGQSVAVDEDVILVGASQDDDHGIASGSVYVFLKPDADWSDTTENYKLTADDAAGEDYFGCSVAVSGTYGLAGASGDDDNGSRSGSAYVFYDVPEPASASLLLL
ncbi:MAG: FG-GAP repeat protein, partial [Phycisphaerae bacterium]|nr:FG-GAP repeat protein [Phycisphaerae bacterium]